MASLKHKLNLIRGVISGARPAVGPVFVDVDVTRRCNLKCLGCRTHSAGLQLASPGDHSIDDIPFELFTKLCRELKAVGTRELLLIGEGEPFLHPNIVEMVVEAKAVGFDLQLYTNGTRITEDVVRRLIKAGLDLLKVSLWATNPDDYVKNYPGTPAKQFDRVVDGLKLISRLKREAGSTLPKVAVCHPVNRNNVKSLEAVPEFLRSVGANSVLFGLYRPRGDAFLEYALSDGERRALDGVLMELEKRFDALSIGHNVNQARLRNEIGPAVWEKVPCYIGWFHTRVRPDGTVTPCDNCHISMGDLKKESFIDIWNGRAYREFRMRAADMEGLAGLNGSDCDCVNCCFVQDSRRVHSVVRLISPFKALFGRRGSLANGGSRG